jgi:Uma2 family endonuclease
MSALADGLLTINEFLALPDTDGKQEFDRGRVIVTPPPKSVHTLALKRIYDRLMVVLAGTNYTAYPEPGFLIAPDIIRQPDVAVMEKGKMEQFKANDYPRGAPLIAIEVASPANSAEELDLQIDQYLRHGSQAVWVAYPRRQAVVRFALVNGRVQSIEYRSGEKLAEEIGTERIELDPAEFFV